MSARLVVVIELPRGLLPHETPAVMQAVRGVTQAASGRHLSTVVYAPAPPSTLVGRLLARFGWSLWSLEPVR